MYTHKKGFLVIPLIGLIIIGLLLFAAVAGAYRVGLSQGHMMGQVTAEGESGGAFHFSPFGARGFGFSPLPLLGCLGGLFLLGLLMLPLVVMFKFFRHRGGQGEPPAHWKAHWKEHWSKHGPPPWWGHEEPPAEAPEAPAKEEPR